MAAKRTKTNARPAPARSTTTKPARAVKPKRAAKLVYDFSEGSKDMKDLLGGKGANLAEMTNIGLPVPPGFTITTEACRAYMRDGDVPAGLMDTVESHLRKLEKAMGRALGDPDDPLLVRLALA